MTFKRLLKSKGYTVNSFSEAIDVNSMSVYRWVSGRFKPSAQNCFKICQLLDISVEELSKIFGSTLTNVDGDIHPFKKLLIERRKTIMSFSRELGVDKSLVYFWMNGCRKVSKKHLHAMKGLLGVNIVDLKRIFKSAKKITEDNKLC